MQPVDEAFDKKLFIHTFHLAFAQVRALEPSKDFLFPQLPPQAVHKEEQVVHRLSTGVDKAPLGAFSAADYRCGIPGILGAKKCLSYAEDGSPQALFWLFVGCSVDNSVSNGDNRTRAGS